MKAKIDTLWNYGIEIIVPDTDDEFDNFSNLSDLKKCENILVGDKDEIGLYEVMIDDQIVYGNFQIYNHPTGCGKLRVFELR